MKYKYANLDFTPKDINEDQKSLRAIFSTADVDRHGEVVDQKSWQLDDFLKNPVVLFGHDHSQPPVGKIVGLGYNQDGNLEGEVKFAADEYPFAKVIWNLYKGGYMKAFSVGFSAGTVDMVDNQIVLKDNILYEISTVAVPANAMALAKSKGIDTSALEEKQQELVTKQEADEDEDAEDDDDEFAEDEETQKAAAKKPKPTKKPVKKPGKKKVIHKAGCPCQQPPKEEEPATEEERTGKEDTAVTEENEKTVKGPISDEIDEEEIQEEKYENMSEFYEISSALWTVYFDDNTPLDAFPALLTEVAKLTQQLADDYVSGEESDDDENETAKAALRTALENKSPEAVKAFVQALSAKIDAKLEQPSLAKSLGALVTSLKEGKVLSKKNRTAIEEALTALQAVLDADTSTVSTDEGKTITKPKRDNSTDLSIRVETPAVRISVPAKGANKAKLINKAIRALLAEKRNN